MPVPRKGQPSVYQVSSLFGHKFKKQSYELVADRSWQAGKAELIYIGISGKPNTTRPSVLFLGCWGGAVRVKFYLG